MTPGGGSHRHGWRFPESTARQSRSGCLLQCRRPGSRRGPGIPPRRQMESCHHGNQRRRKWWCRRLSRRSPRLSLGPPDWIRGRKTRRRYEITGRCFTYEIKCLKMFFMTMKNGDQEKQVGFWPGRRAEWQPATRWRLGGSLGACPSPPPSGWSLIFWGAEELFLVFFWQESLQSVNGPIRGQEAEMNSYQLKV